MIFLDIGAILHAMMTVKGKMESNVEITCTNVAREPALEELSKIAIQKEASII